MSLEHHKAAVKVPHVQWELFGDDNITGTLDDKAGGKFKMLPCKSFFKIKNQ